MKTRQEFAAEFDKLHAQKQDIIQKINHLCHEYINSLPFKEGDCVKIYGRNGEVMVEKAWIVSLYMLGFYSLELELKFVRPRKDGSRSNRCERLWGSVTAEQIELINEQ